MGKQGLMEIHQANNVLISYMTFIKSADKAMKYTDARLRAETGLSFIRYMVLRTIANNGGTLTYTEVAKRTLRKRNDISGLVWRMVQDGLVVAERSDRDRRLVNITLTDKGKGVLPRLVLVVKEVADQVLLSLSKAETVELEKLMEVLGQNADDGLEYVSKVSRPEPDLNSKVGENG